MNNYKLIDLNKMFYFLIYLVSFQSIVAQVPFPGACPDDVEVQQNFNLSKYTGKWYESERYFSFFELGGKCVTADYSINKNGDLKIENRQLNAISGTESVTKGTAKFVDNEDEGKLKVRFPKLRVAIDAPYWIVGTDYDHYAVVYSCFNLGLFNIKNAWILTRSRDPSEEILEKAYSVVEDNNISKTYFIKTDQENCSEKD